ncbi:AAA family ATPase [Leptolyngbyaceae cyanobacterium UHCC 1019]
MIPQRLVLKNFLSYQAATLDFQGLHTACICGANGAGKSSLLEAIAWVIWGESRVTSEDDVIHMGAQEVQVDFIFTTNQHTYRILRTRQRAQGTTLEFQVAMEEAKGERQEEQRLEDKTEIRHSTFDIRHSTASLRFRSLTAKGVRATQQLIVEHLKLDYDTFINSAYLRQGRADEFMVKRPTERKQILADLLKLNQYDELTEKAKDQSRQLKGQIDLLERNLGTIAEQLQQQTTIATEQAIVEASLAEMQRQQIEDETTLQALQVSQQQRITWQQQLTWQQQQEKTLEQDCQRFQQELAVAQQQQQEIEALLRQADAIAAGYLQFQTLQLQEEQFSSKFRTHQLVQTQQQHYQQQQQEKIAELDRHLQHTQTQLEALAQQEQDIQQSLRKAAEVEKALKELQQARTDLTRLDQLQFQAAPLFQRRQQIQQQLDRSHTRLSARLEELRASAHQLSHQQKRQPELQQAVMSVSDRIAQLETQRHYLQQVREKGVERRNFMERLHEQQREYETQLAEVDQKIDWLKQETIDNSTNSKETSHIYPPCPLCDRPLDEHHWSLVLGKHQTTRLEILQEIWVIREQLAASEREIQILRQEYREVDKGLTDYTTVLERRGQLQEQLQSTISGQANLSQLETEAAKLEHTLNIGNYAADLSEELAQIDHRLQQLNYDDKDHALARGQVDRWRWAEIKQAEIKQARQRQTNLAQRQPELQTQQVELESQIKQLKTDSETALAQFNQQLNEIGYDLEQHNALRIALRQAQPYQLHYQELYKYQQHYPQFQRRFADLNSSLNKRQSSLKIAQAQIKTLQQQLQEICDRRPAIQATEDRIRIRRSELDQQLSALGRLQQQQQQLVILTQQQTAIAQQLQTLTHQQRVYQEVAQAFGKNGIQALMIENALPQLEAETNRILGRLSANQLHIQFITQRSGNSSKAKLKQAKWSETLDIVIADTQGTRPYETYSGGEAFRVNFAIRLALARFLAQRSGTALQMLIVDEGFGTQDAEGCDRLIAAINAIASDFACILTVTHVPHFKEAFQSRIEVIKTDQGSQLQFAL